MSAGVVAPDCVGFGCEPELPEVECRVRDNAPLHRVHHPGACPTTAHARVLEEGDVAPGRPRLVGVEEVIHGGVVLVDRLLHEPESEDARVEVHVPGRVGRDARDVVDPVKTHCTQVSRRPLGSPG